MPQPYLSEIRIFPWEVVPRGWAQCAGQSLEIATHRALYDVIGDTYGGDGSTVFALPNLLGRVGRGASDRVRLGALGGAEQHALTDAEMPGHDHPGQASPEREGDTSVAGGHVLCGQPVWTARGTPAPLRSDSVDAAGANAPHDNMAPFLALNFCIAIEGSAP